MSRCVCVCVCVPVRQSEVWRSPALVGRQKWGVYKRAFLEKFILGERQKRLAWSRWNKLSMTPQETVIWSSTIGW